MPFRYGIAELTETPHLFCEIELEVDGERGRGIAADSLIPKWFTKDPDQTYEEEIAAMLAVIGKAVAWRSRRADAPDVFSLWRRRLSGARELGSQHAASALLWNFGVSLVERAIIDAYCRALQTHFARTRCARTMVGDRPGPDSPRTDRIAPGSFLPTEPSHQTLFIRHTSASPTIWLNPTCRRGSACTTACRKRWRPALTAYGLRYFKIKVNGDDERDIEPPDPHRRHHPSAAPRLRLHAGRQRTVL